MPIIRYLHTSGEIRHAAARNGDETFYDIEGDVFGAFRMTERPAEVQKLLAPIQPVAILGIGLNYRKHAEETKARIPEFPVLFFKGINSLQHPDEPIVLPRHLRSDRVDYECELAVVIGKACKNVAPSEALRYVLGYTCANDVSAREWQIQRGGSQWSRAKSFDTFSPLGPRLVTTEENPDPQDLGIRTILSGETVQDWRTDDMIFSVAEIVSFLSGSSTLLPGTVIMTGTPHGVGMARRPPRWLQPGDVVSIEIDGIGRLTNPVIEESTLPEHESIWNSKAEALS